MILRNNMKFLFTGDSITDSNRNDSAYQPYGNGYVHFAAYYLMAKYPELGIQVINTGVSGNTSTQLMRRWKADCIEHNADVITMLIGVNDLWRRYKTYDKEKASTAVYPEQYETNYRTMIEAVQFSRKSDIIMVEPFMFCDDKGNDMFKELKYYQNICAKLASEYKVKLVCLQSEIDSLLNDVSCEKWSNDMVHPLPWVHCWISQRWLDVALEPPKH